MEPKEIIKPLFHLYKKYRDKTTEVDKATRAAQLITKKWQESFKFHPSITSEVPIFPDSRFKIDLIDYGSDRITAYELKVSGNNPHHEFYKDIFKVIIHNKKCTEDKRIEKLVFITEEVGMTRLVNSDLGREILESGVFKFEVNIMPIK